MRVSVAGQLASSSWLLSIVTGVYKNTDLSSVLLRTCVQSDIKIVLKRRRRCLSQKCLYASN